MAVVATIVGDDMVVVTCGSGLQGGGQRGDCSAVDQPGTQCCCSRALPGGSEAGGVVLVVVNNIVSVIDASIDVADGGCAGFINDGMVDVGDVNGLVGVSSWGVICMSTLMVVMASDFGNVSMLSSETAN